MTVRNYKQSVDFELTKQFEGNAFADLTDEEKEQITFSITNADGTPVQHDVIYFDENGQECSRKEDDPSFIDIPLTALTDGHFTFTGLGHGHYKLVENDNIVAINHPDWERLKTFLWEGIEGDSTFVVTEEQVARNENIELTLTNNYTKEVVELQVQKKWQNTFGQATLWPGTTPVTIDLYIKDGDALTPVMNGENQVSITLDGVKDNNGEDKAGTAFFKNLSKLTSGKEYVVKEREDESISNSYNTFYNSAGNDYSTFSTVGNATQATIYNRQKSTSITVNKTWKQVNTDTDNNPPADATATFRLYAYTESTGATGAKRVSGVNDITIDAEPWTVTFLDLPFVNANGEALIYTVKEISCTENFSPNYPAGQDYALAGQTIVNTPGTVSLSFKKEWRNTFSNQWPSDAAIIVDITRRLRTTQEGNTYYYTDPGFLSSYQLTPDTCTHDDETTTPLSWDQTALVPSWQKINNSYAFVLQGLDKIGHLDEHYGTWEYMVSERKVIDANSGSDSNDYDTVYYLDGQAQPPGTTFVTSGGVIRNSGKALVRSFTKQWHAEGTDADVYDGPWPSGHVITVRLSREFRYEDTSGNKITVPDQSDWEPIEVQVDENGIIPESISTHDDITVTADGDVFSFANLPSFGVGRADGKSRYGEFVYSITETQVTHDGNLTDYKPQYLANGSLTTIQNRLVPRIDIPVTKTWLKKNGDPVDAALITPVELTLYRKTSDDEPLTEDDGHITTPEGSYLPVTINRDQEMISPSIRLDGTEGWTYTFANLPMYTDATNTTQQEYLVVETKALVNDAGTSTWTSDIETYFKVTYTKDNSGFIVNNCEASHGIDVSVQKAWKNLDNTTTAPDGASVTFTLFADGTAVEDKSIVLDGTTDDQSALPAENGDDHYESAPWTATWTGLEEFQSDGTTPIVYTIQETIGVDGYEADGSASPDGTITNYEKEAFQFTKAWLDFNTTVIDGKAESDCMAWPDNTSISVVLKRRDTQEDTSFALSYTIDKGSALIQPDNKELTDEEKKLYELTLISQGNYYTFTTQKVFPQGYTYYMEEQTVSPFYDDPYYGSFDQGFIRYTPSLQMNAHNGDVIINKEAARYKLPYTGGMGTRWFFIAGFGILTLATLLFLRGSHRA